MNDREREEEATKLLENKVTDWLIFGGRSPLPLWPDLDDMTAEESESYADMIEAAQIDSAIQDGR